MTQEISSLGQKARINEIRLKIDKLKQKENKMLKELHHNSRK